MEEEGGCLDFKLARVTHPLPSNVWYMNTPREKKLNEQVNTSQRSLNPIFLPELS